MRWEGGESVYVTEKDWVGEFITITMDWPCCLALHPRFGEHFCESWQPMTLTQTSMSAVFLRGKFHVKTREPFSEIWWLLFGYIIYAFHSHFICTVCSSLKMSAIKSPAVPSSSDLCDRCSCSGGKSSLWWCQRPGQLSLSSTETRLSWPTAPLNILHWHTVKRNTISEGKKQTNTHFYSYSYVQVSRASVM